MTARFYADMALVPGTSVSLPEQTARHVQVLRLQPGGHITLFNGQGDGQPGSEGEFAATVERMGRSDVQVAIGAYTATAREAGRAIHLAVGMPANERMDWLIEKATELGAASIQPLLSERSVLRLSGERADKKLAHWRGVATAACEQCGRNRLPLIHEVASLADWLKRAPTDSAAGSRLQAAAVATGRHAPAGPGRRQQRRPDLSERPGRRTERRRRGRSPRPRLYPRDAGPARAAGRDCAAGLPGAADPGLNP